MLVHNLRKTNTQLWEEFLQSWGTGGIATHECVHETENLQAWANENPRLRFLAFSASHLGALGNQPKALSSVCGTIAHRWQQSPYQLHTGITQHFFMATGFPSAQCGNNHHQMWCSIVSIPLPMVHSKNKARIVSLNNRDSCRKIALNVRLVLYNRSILLEASQHTCKWVKDSRLETQKWRSALWLVSNPCWIMHLKDNCDLIFYRALSLPRDKADTPTVLASKDTKRSNGSTMWFSTSQV